MGAVEEELVCEEEGDTNIKTWNLQKLRNAYILLQSFPRRAVRIFFIPEPSMYVRAMLTLQKCHSPIVLSLLSAKMSFPYSPKSAFSQNVIPL